MDGISKRKRIAHVVRRLGFGTNAGVAAGLADTDNAIAWALDPSRTAPDLPNVDPPTEPMQRDRQSGRQLYQDWCERLLSVVRPIEKRLVWFWHDHFASERSTKRFRSSLDPTSRHAAEPQQ